MNDFSMVHAEYLVRKLNQNFLPIIGLIPIDLRYANVMILFIPAPTPCESRRVGGKNAVLPLSKGGSIGRSVSAFGV